MALEIDTTIEMRDSIAEIVMDRFRRAIEYRSTHIVHQRQSFDSLMFRADHQFRREYTPDDEAAMFDAFGFVPTRYYGVTQQKVMATVAWNSDLVINNLDNMFTVSPSPEPEIDAVSRDRIRAGVRLELQRRIQEAGLADPALLLTEDGQPNERINGFLQEQTRALKQIEQSRIVSLATESAALAQARMRDTMIEGGFRQAYSAYTFDRCLHGMGVIKFPDFQRRAVLKHKGKNGVAIDWQVKPWFRHVRVQDFYPIADAIDTQTNTGNTEYTFYTKAELIGLATNDDYFKDEIRDIIEDYAYQTRDWFSSSQDAGYWGLDDVIPVLIHEGFFSGGELSEYGISGIDEMDYVSARVEVCGSRTIRCTLLKMPGGADRSYFVSPFSKVGTNIFDCLGMAAMLYDTEQRVNRFMHLFENNADWATRPPIMTNPSVFDNPNDAMNVVPGGQYQVEDKYGVAGQMPEPMRPMNTVSAQYHLLMSQVGALLRQADEDCGIPAFAYGAQDFGRSSLGEYSQRMSNALRTLKQAALNEDIYFIEPGFTGLFHYEMKEDRELREGQDVGIVIRGMTGLLKQDAQIQAMASTAPMVLGDQSGIVPQQVKEYALRQLLEDAGFPVDALGMGNPMLDNALAVAANMPLPGFNPGGQQVPPLDGRSGVPTANTASPGGISNVAIPSPSLGG